MKVSVVYCTARHGGLDILDRSMSEQTHQDLEIIIVDELHRDSLNFYKRRPMRFIPPPPKKPGMFWNLSASLNAGVRAATGDIIVLLQDYIWVPPTGIERYISRFLEEPQSIITGIGHQYSEPSKIDNPTGLYSTWKDWPGAPTGKRTFTDPRAEKTGFSLTIPVEWEANWGAFPRLAWQLVGGFDEMFDLGWGYDNVNFAERCQLAGYHIFLDTHNEVLCYDHILLFGESERRNAAPNNQRLWHDKYRGMAKHGEPWRLGYATQEGGQNV